MTLQVIGTIVGTNTRLECNDGRRESKKVMDVYIDVRPVGEDSYGDSYETYVRVPQSDAHHWVTGHKVSLTAYTISVKVDSPSASTPNP